MVTTIGVIINQIEGAFFSTQWKDLIHWAEKKGVRLIFFTGKAYDSPLPQERIHNFTYLLALASELDGLLVFSSSLGNFVGAQGLQGFLHQFPLPIVTLHSRIPGFSSINIESKQAIWDMINHLVRDHHYTRFGLVTGPDTNEDSRHRLQIFQEAFVHHGVSLDGIRVFQGDFSPESGVKGAKFFEKEGLPEAILCFNDDMAQSVIEYLVSQGVAIPTEVAVTGFDGFDFSEKLYPAITTIKQPFQNIIEKGAQHLYEQIQDPHTPRGDYLLHCHLRMGQSCGCQIPADMEVTGQSLKGVPQAQWEELLHKESNLVLQFLEHSSEVDIHKIFLQHLKRLGEESPCKEDHIRVLEDLYRTNVAAVAQKSYKETYSLFTYHWRLRNISQRISRQVNLPSLIQELGGILQELKNYEFGLYLFKTPLIMVGHLPELPEEIEVFLEYDSKGLVLNREGKTVLVHQILTGQASYIVKSLVFDNQIFGFFKLGSGETQQDMLSETLMELITNALHQIHIYGKMVEAQRKLEFSLTETRMLQKKFKDLSIMDEMTGLLNRRGFFEVSQELLQQAGSKDVFFLFYMDMDGLKTINDNFGHPQGDWAICAFGRTLKECFRSSDVVGRLGGDEFIALSKAPTQGYAQGIKERIKQKLNEVNKSSDKDFDLAASIGYIQFINEGNQNFSRLILQADQELYKIKFAKREGKK